MWKNRTESPDKPIQILVTYFVRVCLPVCIGKNKLPCLLQDTIMKYCIVLLFQMAALWNYTTSFGGNLCFVFQSSGVRLLSNLAKESIKFERTNISRVKGN